MRKQLILAMSRICMTFSQFYSNNNNTVILAGEVHKKSLFSYGSHPLEHYVLPDEIYTHLLAFQKWPGPHWACGILEVANGLDNIAPSPGAHFAPSLFPGQFYFN